MRGRIKKENTMKRLNLRAHTLSQNNKTRGREL
jgi:hypothetical protein